MEKTFNCGLVGAFGTIDAGIVKSLDKAVQNIQCRCALVVSKLTRYKIGIVLRIV